MPPVRPPGWSLLTHPYDRPDPLLRPTTKAGPFCHTETFCSRAARAAFGAEVEAPGHSIGRDRLDVCQHPRRDGQRFDLSPKQPLSIASAFLSKYFW